MKLAVVGKGQMGQLIQSTATQRAHEVVLGDTFDQAPIVDNKESLEVVVDFSHPNSLDFVLEALKDTPCALVMGTTGFSKEQVERLKEEAKVRPIFYASNYSVGVAVLTRLVQEANKMLGDWDKEIIEAHHHKKVDAPSGTALSLLSALDPNDEYDHVFGRFGKTGARGHEIAVHAVRGGSVPGNHEVLFLGDQEVISLEHNAQSRQIFVNGALDAAEFIVGKPAGLYDMSDLLKERLG